MRRSVAEKKTEKKTGYGIGIVIKTAFLAATVLAAASIVFYFGTRVHAAQAPAPPANQKLSSKSLTLPMFFEPNQGQSATQVKFLARGSGCGLFLTADEAVLQLQRSAVSHQPSGFASRASPEKGYTRPSNSLLG